MSSPGDTDTELRHGARGGARITSYRVTVEAGPDVGKTFIVDGAQPSRALVGKSPACLVLLTDAQVSRRHAALDAADGPLKLTDVGSTNGTFVDGLEIVEARLRGGERITLGNTTLRVDAIDAPSVPVPQIVRFGRALGVSLEMRRLFPLCERLALSAVPVVIEGETGTGKELVAESLHEEGPRCEMPFVVFDCASTTPSAVEETLFGREQRTASGELVVVRGLFEQARDGTLMLDEIGELDASVQPKLLRAIERSEIRRIGGEQAVQVNVRIIATSRKNLDQETQAGRFREDLFFRLCVARIELPPLRERRGDIAVLANYFWQKLGGSAVPLPEDLLARFEQHTWPGNLRELRNALARRLATRELDDDARYPVTRASGADDLEKSDGTGAANDLVRRVLALDLPLTRARQLVVDHFERAYVERVLALHDGNVARASAASGLARRYFQLLKARHAK